MKKIPYGKQYITQDDIEAVTKVLTSDFLTQGPKVNEFEEKFSSYVGSKYAVAVSNGTAALHLCAMSLGVNKNSKVITSPLTFVASSNAILYCGGTVDFCDINPKTLLIDIDKLKAKLENSPMGTYSGIIPVDFAGCPVQMDEIKSLADRYNLWIIEDSCHAPGGSFIDSNQKNQYCGNGIFSDLSIFSFHPVKHIACGEGGMITTNSDHLYRKLLKLRSHGVTKDKEELDEYHGGWYYEMNMLGYNYRLSDIACALGISQLERAMNSLERRRNIASYYIKKLAGISEIEVYNENIVGHAFHLFVIRADQRNELYDFLKTKNIFTQVHYIPVHLQPYYRKLGFKQGDYPEVENYYASCLSLPIYPSIKQEELDYVIHQIKIFYNKK